MSRLVPQVPCRSKEWTPPGQWESRTPQGDPLVFCTRGIEKKSGSVRGACGNFEMRGAEDIDFVRHGCCCTDRCPKALRCRTRGRGSPDIFIFSFPETKNMTSETTALFQRLTRGVYVIGVAHEAQYDIFAAASVMLASHRPLMLAVGINPRHASYPLARAGRVFAVSVLKPPKHELARCFGTQSGRDPGKLEGISWHCGPCGAPIVDDAPAHFECEMSAVMPAGDHEIIVGRVIDCRVPEGRSEPWLYPDAADTDRSVRLPRQPFPVP
jgi:flavin reductase (DIM6/NTAB) family NADH-FMN oxidoreductase RutF